MENEQLRIVVGMSPAGAVVVGLGWLHLRQQPQELARIRTAGREIWERQKGKFGIHRQGNLGSEGKEM